MTKHSKLTHSADSAVSSVAQTEPSEIRKRAEDLANELVGNVQFYETQERWGCFDIAKGWPEVIKAPHTKHGRLKRVLTASLVPKIEAALRLSEDAARSSESWPGVGGAVESNAVDEKGEPREPEKLNNAHKEKAMTFMEAVEGIRVSGVKAKRVGWGDSYLYISRKSSIFPNCSFVRVVGKTPKRWQPLLRDVIATDWALAESSLSSPPLKDKDVE